MGIVLKIDATEEQIRFFLNHYGFTPDEIEFAVHDLSAGALHRFWLATSTVDEIREWGDSCEWNVNKRTSPIYIDKGSRKYKEEHSDEN